MPTILEGGVTMLTLNEIRGILSQNMLQLREKETTPSVSNAMVNAAGKILSSIKLEMEYAKALGRTPNIPIFNERAEDLESLAEQSIGA